MWRAASGQLCVDLHFAAVWESLLFQALGNEEQQAGN